MAAEREYIVMPPSTGIGYDFDPAQPDGRRGINTRYLRREDVERFRKRKERKEPEEEKKPSFFDSLKDMGPLAALFLVAAVVFVRNP